MLADEIRREMTEDINSRCLDREALEKLHGQVWNTQELQQDFEVIGFAAPCVVVERKSDGVKGSVMFQHRPRFYFSFSS